jgi:putative hydrolase of the HAD superfamily/5'-nucleotidase
VSLHFSNLNLLDQFSVLLLDMNGTFMFGEDRFGTNEDFYTTYRSVGGVTLTPTQVSAGIRGCHEGMLRLCRSPQQFDDFPSLAEGLRRYADVPESELPRLEQIFALHECGSVPPDYAALLRRLRHTHQLGLVTNIWARKAAWLSEFDRAGISDVFTCEIFSSDSRSIKPSPTLFRHALQSFPADASVLFVGDSLHRDIEPARALGIATAWINALGETSPYADYILPNLLAIEAKTPNKTIQQRGVPAAVPLRGSRPLVPRA